MSLGVWLVGFIAGSVREAARMKGAEVSVEKANTEDKIDAAFFAHPRPSRWTRGRERPIFLEPTRADCQAGITPFPSDNLHVPHLRGDRWPDHLCD